MSIIGYLTATEVEPSLFLGAAMSTDRFGLPAEFRYTEPVRATRLQRILYGSALHRYLCREVIASTLLQAMETNPQVWIVQEELLLEPLEAMRAPVVMLLPSEAAPMDDLGATLPVGEDEMLVQLSLAGAPLRVRFGDTDPERRQHAIQVLTEAAHTMDLLEPLHRLQQALRVVQEEQEAA
ncbi:MAG: hypothetical protein RMM06_00020 [Armatimonadota bacterium]|nr:hypothetical protein [Armatimonadota bacterium]MDW8105002.1 hypothetical protein [Armatimonadota bacterium]MDW8289078.1 hypothetical protein [Armatimonadota bacterium]